MKLIAILAITFISLKAAATDVPGHYKGSCDALTISQTYNKNGTKGEMGKVVAHTELDEVVAFDDGSIAHTLTGTVTSSVGPEGFTYTTRSKTKIERLSRNSERDTISFEGDEKTKAFTVIEEIKIEPDGSKTSLGQSDKNGKVKKIKGYNNRYSTADGTSVSYKAEFDQWNDLADGKRLHIISSKMTCLSHLVND